MMDEKDAIREFRAEIPGPTTAESATARAALLEHVRGEPEAPPRRRPRPVLPRPLTWPRLTIAGALAVGLAVALITLSPGGAGVQSAAAEVLRRAAQSAAVQPPQSPPAAGQELFMRAKEAHLTISVREGPRVAARIRRHLERHPNEGVRQPVWSAFVPVEREMWIDANGSGRIREVSGRARFLSAAQRAAWVAAGSPPLPRPGTVRTQHFDRHDLSGLYFSGLQRLPTEPRRLRRWIEAHDLPGESISAAGTASTGLPAVRAPESKTFGAVGFLLGTGIGPPALRAALYEVAAELPGVQLLGKATDPTGREGVGVAYTDREHGQRLELIFDPATSTLLGERWIVTSPRRSGIAVPAGTVFGYASFSRSSFVAPNATR